MRKVTKTKLTSADNVMTAFSLDRIKGKLEYDQHTKLYKLGKDVVYESAWNMAEKVLSQFINVFTEKAALTPIISCEMQGGKTGMMSLVIRCFQEAMYYLKHVNYDVFPISALDSTNLADQTTLRLTYGRKEDGIDDYGAELDFVARHTHMRTTDFKVLNMSRALYNNAVKSHPVDGVPVRLILIDEIHYANTKFGIIDKTLRHYGVKINEPMSKWDKTHGINIVVGISATPFAHVLKSDKVSKKHSTDVSEKSLFKDTSLFKICWSQMPDAYNSVRHMLKNGRAQQVHDTFSNDGTPTEFLPEVLKTAQKEVRKYGSGILLVRTYGKEFEYWKLYCHKHELDWAPFDCTDDNIGELIPFLEGKNSNSKDLLEKRSNLIVCLIKGSLRAGMTIEDDRYIRGMVDSNSKNTDTVAQSLLGRACGFNGKKERTYTIWCNLKKAQSYASFCTQMDTGILHEVPSSCHSRPTKLVSHKPYSVRLLDSPEAAEEELKRILSPEVYKKVVAHGGRYQKLSSYRAGSNPELRGNLLQCYELEKLGSEVRTSHWYVILDGPQPAFQSDWNRVVVPNGWQGKVFFIDRTKSESVDVKMDLDTRQKKNSALKN